MGRKHTYPPKELLDSVEEITAVKETLPQGHRKLVDANGLYILKHDIDGEVLYVARGAFFVKLAYLTGANGSRRILRYQPGDWEVKVYETLQRCHSLAITSNRPNVPRGGNSREHQAPEAINSRLLKQAFAAYQQHYAENNRQWHQAGLCRWAELQSTFAEKLRKEYPTEYAELATARKRSRGIEEAVQRAIIKGYVSGYMFRRGWISRDALTSVIFYLGERIACTIRDNIPDARSSGTTFAACLARISAIGAGHTDTRRD